MPDPRDTPYQFAPDAIVKIGSFQVALKSGTTITHGTRADGARIVFDPPFVAPETGLYVVDLNEATITRAEVTNA